MVNLYEKNTEKLWNSNKKLTASEMLLYLFLSYKWKENEYEKFKYSDYTIAKQLKLSRQTIIKAKKKLKKVQLLEFSHRLGRTTTYSFPDLTEIKNSYYEVNLEEPKEKNNIPKEEEFISYAKLSPLYKESLLEDIIEMF